MRKQPCEIYLLVILFILLLTSCKSSWYTFQYNNQRTAYTENPAIKSPVVRWKTQIGIQGYLNNSVIADQIYVGSSGDQHNTPDERDGIYCLNKKSGAIIWHFRTETDACGVAYADGRIYSTGDDGYLRCLDAKSGEELWHTQFDGELYAQPLIVGEMVIIGDESGSVIATNRATGKHAWMVKLASTNIRGGLSADKQHIYAAFEEGRVACLDMKGGVVWMEDLEYKDEFGEDFQQIYGAPTVLFDKLIIPFSRSTYYNKPAIYALNINDGSIAWKAAKDESASVTHGNIRSSVAIWKNLILFGNPYSNSLIAVNLSNGEMAWNLPFGDCMFPHWPSPVIAGNTLYLGRHDGGFGAIDLEKQQVSWQLYLGDHDQVQLRPRDYGTNPGSSAPCNWDPATGSSIYATPAIDKKGTIYIGNGEGWFFAIGE